MKESHEQTKEHQVPEPNCGAFPFVQNHRERSEPKTQTGNWLSFVHSPDTSFDSELSVWVFSPIPDDASGYIRRANSVKQQF